MRVAGRGLMATMGRLLRCAMLLVGAAAAAARSQPGAALAESSEAADNGILPETFDSRLAWFGCGLTVLDQACCPPGP